MDSEIDYGGDTPWTWAPVGCAARRVVLDCADQMGIDTSRAREELATVQ
ncbi:hypothetical protein [Hyphomicrobium sp. DY-1]